MANANNNFDLNEELQKKAIEKATILRSIREEFKEHQTVFSTKVNMLKEERNKILAVAKEKFGISTFEELKTEVSKVLKQINSTEVLVKTNLAQIKDAIESIPPTEEVKSLKVACDKWVASLNS